MLGKITVTLFFILLIWGNLVAGLGVGLACPDWPLCHGEIIPPLEFGIFMEWMHRNIGAVASMFLCILCHIRFRSYSGASKSIPLIAVFLLLFQIILGGVVVLMKLPVDLTTVHFANAIIIYSLVLYMAFFDENEKKPVFSLGGVSSIFFLVSLVIFCQAVLGAYVRHSDSGLACPDFPKCLGFWIPPDLSGTVLIHFLHRAFGYFIFLAVLLLYVLSHVNQRLEAMRSKILLIISLIFLQIILGVAVIHSKLHFSAAALHLGVALLILSIALYIWFQNMTRSHV